MFLLKLIRLTNPHRVENFHTEREEKRAREDSLKMSREWWEDQNHPLVIKGWLRRERSHETKEDE